MARRRGACPAQTGGPCLSDSCLSNQSRSAAIQLHVLGAVDESNARSLGTGEKAHRRAVHERDVPHIEDDATVCLLGEELLQSSRMLDVHVTAESEHDRFYCGRAMDSVRQSPVSWFARQSKAPANPKCLVP